MSVHDKITLWPELKRLAVSNNLRKKLEAVQAKIAGRFSNQELPIFRLIIAEGAGLFHEPDDVARLGDAFPSILSQTYEGSETTPLGHERSYNEGKILGALRSSKTLQEFLGRFPPGPAAAQPKKRKPLFRRLLAADAPGGNSHLSWEENRYEASVPYRSRQHLLTIMEHLGIRLESVPREKQAALKNTFFEIEGIPDLQQPGTVTLLSLPVRIVVHGKPGQSGGITFMILDSHVPDGTFNLPERVQELDNLLATV